MLYHLFRYLDEAYDLPGSGMFQYISFRAAAAIILSLLIVIIFGRSIIDFLRRKQIGEEIRDLGLQGQLQKKGTPTMGGVIILVAILVPMLLFGKLDNVYIQLLLVSTVWLGLIGGLDDYIKVFRHRKEGLKGRFKIVGQVGLGVIVGTTMWLSPDIVVREKVTQPVQTVYLNENGTVLETVQRHVVVSSESLKTTQTTIPFVKNNEFDYGWLTGGNSVATWILYVLVAIFVVTAVSNGANLTDGLDGLATGVSVPIVAVLGVLAYLSGHIVYADYLNIMYIPGSGEMVVFAAALVGALVGFLWYNSFPAQIFMGDTGSLAIGGVIAWIFKPLGWGNWQAAVASITGLVAKENIVGTLGILYGGGDGTVYQNIGAAFTGISGFSFLVFNLLCAPCFAAIGAIKREMNNRKWTWFAIGYQCGFAYLISLMINQFGGLFTGSVNVIGLIFALAALALMVYMLVRPYKEATKLNAKV